MKKLKQIIAILVIGTLLFTACDNRDEVEGIEEVSPCNYTFTATPTTQNLVVDVDGTITLNIAKQSNISCGTKYTMAHTITNNGTSVSNTLFVYGGDATDVAIGDTSGTFNTSVIGTYVIKFTMTNDGADINKVQTETVTINVTYPPIVLAIPNKPADDKVYVNQDANYRITFSGGNPANNEYTVLLTTTGDDLEPTITILTLGTDVVSQTSPLNFKITPTKVGAAIYTVKVSQDGVSATQDFTLTSEASEFDVELKLNGSIDDDNDSTHPSGTISATSNGQPPFSGLSIDVKSIQPDDINYNITYTYEIDDGNTSENSFEINNNTPATFPPQSNEVITDTSLNLPQQLYFIKTTAERGIKEIRVKVSNDFGHEVTKSIWIEIID